MPTYTNKKKYSWYERFVRNDLLLSILAFAAIAVPMLLILFGQYSQELAVRFLVISFGVWVFFIAYLYFKTSQEQKEELEEQKEINRELYYLFYLEQEKKRKEVYTITKMQEAQLRELKRSLDDIVNKISPDDEITDPSIP